MAISTRKINLIIADFKTGAYSKKELQKKHKITDKTLKKYTDGISAENAYAVEALHEAKMVEKSVKNPIELKAVQNVVENKLKITNLSVKLLNKIDDFIENGKAKKVITVGSGQGCSSSEVVEYDLQSTDYKNLADTIDKASITLGVNERFSSSQVAINNSNNQQNNKVEIVGYGVEIIKG